MIQSSADVADELVRGFGQVVPTDEAQTSPPVVVSGIVPETAAFTIRTIEGRRFAVRTTEIDP